MPWLKKMWWIQESTDHSGMIFTKYNVPITMVVLWIITWFITLPTVGSVPNELLNCGNPMLQVGCCQLFNSYDLRAHPTDPGVGVIG